jgi:hypothetical protein
VSGRHGSVSGAVDLPLSSYPGSMRTSLLLSLVLASAVGHVLPAQVAPVVIMETVQVCRTAVDAPTPPAPSAACSSVRTQDVDPQGAALWMLSEVTIPPAMAQSRAPMAVLMQAMASSAIYWDGQLIGSSGVVSTSAAREVAGQFVHVVPLRPDELRPGTHTIAVHLSNHRGPLRVQVPVHVLAVAPLDAIREGIGAGGAPTLLALGALMMASLYFAVAARRVARRQDAALVAGLIFCALVQGGAELWRVMLPITYVEQIWRLLLIFVAATALGACLVAYSARRFHYARQRWYLLTYALTAPLTWALLPGFDARTFVVLAAAGGLALAAAAPAAWRGEPGSRAITVVLALLYTAAPLTTGGFLERDLFLGLTVLSMVLLVDQLRIVRQEQLDAAEARASVERLQLELLRRRLTPHWLLNMLNALIAWIEEEPTTAVRMVGLLGEEFRRLAHPIDTPLIPLHDELAACRRLLELMSLRSGRTFTLDDSGVSPALEVPPGVLHTLVENALTHGRYRMGATFTVRHVDAQGGGTALAFDAPGADLPLATHADPSSHDSGSDGFGLTYVRARLAAAFGASGTLTHGPRHDGGWRTTLHLGGVSA